MTDSRLEQISCIFCGSQQNITFCDTHDIFDNYFEIKCCDSCRFYFLAPAPSPELIAKAYDSSYYGNSDTKFSFTIVEKATDYFRRQRAQQIVKHLSANARILDIGCGNGDFLRYISALGDYELYGIERDEIAARRAQRQTNIHLQTTPLSEANYPANYFDAVTLFHVFEHLPNPKATIDIIANILKPDGVLFITVPNIDSFQAKVFKGYWLHLDSPRHFLFFKPNDFVAMMAQNGFSLMKTNYLSIEQNPFGMIQSILNVFCKKRDVLFERLKGNNQYAPEYGRFSVFLQKCFFVLGFPIFIISDIFESFLKKGATVQFSFRNTKVF